MPHNKFTGILFAFSLLFLCSWWLAGWELIPTFITEAYYGRGPEFLNQIITGQATYSLQYYLEIWRATSIRILLAIVGLSATVLILTRPEFEKFVERKQLRRGLDFKNIPKLRGGAGLKAKALILGMIICSALCIWQNGEYWPFSQYSMYAGCAPSSTTVARLFGLSTDGEFPLLEKHSYLSPFDTGRLELALFRLTLRDNGMELVKKALADCLLRYERNRVSGLHHGPILKGIRVYELSWDLKRPPLEAAHPHAKNLVYEYIQ